MTVHKLTAKEKVAKARAALVQAKPFWGFLLYRLIDAPDNRVPTMATDGKHLRYNEEWVLGLDFDHLQTVLAHEVQHCALGHPFRRGDRDPQRWNEAADHAVNLGLIEDGSFKMPDDALCDHKFAGMSSESIYSVLSQQQQQQQQQQGDGGAGEGSGSPSSPADPSQSKQQKGEDEQKPSEPEQQGDEGESEEPGDEGDGDVADDGDDEGDEHGGEDASDKQRESNPFNAPGSSMGDVLDAGTFGDADGEGEGQPLDPAQMQELAEDWASAVAAAVMQAEAQGDISANAALQIRQSFEEPMSFEEYMRMFAQKMKRTDTSWARPNRRMQHAGIYMPSQRNPGVGKLVYAVDTSGSVVSVLPRFEGAARRVQVDLKPEETIVIYCDARVKGEERFAEGEEVRFSAARGGGGTSFVPVFERVQQMIEEGEDIAGIIFVTDLLGTFPDEEEVAGMPPVLWVSTQKREAPFGETCYFHNA